MLFRFGSGMLQLAAPHRVGQGLEPRRHRHRRARLALGPVREIEVFQL